MSISDLTGELCRQNQAGPVFYLAGTFGFFEPLATVKRYCTVPNNTYFFFPLLNAWTSVLEEGDRVKAIRELANRQIVDFGRQEDEEGKLEAEDALELSLSIDGQDVGDPRATRAQTPLGGLPIEIMEDTLATFFQNPPGPKAINVMDGYWVLLPPLRRPGEHVIRFTAKAPAKTPGAVPFNLDVTYYLNVVRGHRD